MFTQLQPRLNRSFVVRYDMSHGLVSEADEVDGVDSFTEIKARLTAGSDHMDVNGIGGIGRTAPLNATRPAGSIDAPAADALSPKDEVQISDAARMMDELNRTSGIREERIAQIQQEIADGSYDTDEKLDAALERFLDKYGFGDE